MLAAIRNKVINAVYCCFVLLVICSFISRQIAFADSIEDDDYTKPQRIVVFPLFAEEILFGLVEPERIVYVGHPYDKSGEPYWPTMSASQGRSGSNWQNSDEHALLSLNPDLLILPSDIQDEYADIFPLLADLNISTLFVDEPKSVNEIIDLITCLGCVVQEPEKSFSMVQNMISTLVHIDSIVCQMPDEERITVALYEEPDPFFRIVCDIAMVNGVYCCAETMLLEENPDVILILPYCTDTDGSLLEIGKEYADASIAQLKNELANSKMAAISEEQIYTMSFHASQYSVESALHLIEIAYPNLLNYGLSKQRAR